MNETIDIPVNKEHDSSFNLLDRISEDPYLVNENLLEPSPTSKVKNTS